MTLNDTQISILRRIRVKINIKELPMQTLEVCLNSIPAISIDGNIIFGRDMLDKENITLVYCPRKVTVNEKAEISHRSYPYKRSIIFMNTFLVWKK